MARRFQNGKQRKQNLGGAYTPWSYHDRSLSELYRQVDRLVLEEEVLICELTDYLRGELSGESKKEVFDAIEETESRLHPDYSDGDILVEINSMKDKLSGEFQ